MRAPASTKNGIASSRKESIPVNSFCGMVTSENSPLATRYRSAIVPIAKDTGIPKPRTTTATIARKTLTSSSEGRVGRGRGRPPVDAGEFGSQGEENRLQRHDARPDGNGEIVIAHGEPE